MPAWRCSSFGSRPLFWAPPGPTRWSGRTPCSSPAINRSWLSWSWLLDNLNQNAAVCDIDPVFWFETRSGLRKAPLAICIRNRIYLYNVFHIKLKSYSLHVLRYFLCVRHICSSFGRTRSCTLCQQKPISTRQPGSPFNFSKIGGHVRTIRVQETE